MNRFEFDVVIEPVPDKGGAYIRVPIDIRKEFGKGRMKVHATFDGKLLKKYPKNRGGIAKIFQFVTFS